MKKDKEYSIIDNLIRITFIITLVSTMLNVSTCYRCCNRSNSRHEREKNSNDRKDTLVKISTAFLSDFSHHKTVCSSDIAIVNDKFFIVEIPHHFVDGGVGLVFDGVINIVNHYEFVVPAKRI